MLWSHSMQLCICTWLLYVDEHGLFWDLDLVDYSRGRPFVVLVVSHCVYVASDYH